MLVMGFGGKVASLVSMFRAAEFDAAGVRDHCWLGWQAIGAADSVALEVVF